MRERERKKEARILVFLLHSSSSCHFSAAAAEGLLCFAAERRCNNKQKQAGLLLYLLRVFLLSWDLWRCLWILLFFRADRSMLVFFSLSSLLLLLLIINVVILPELMQQSCLISYSWDSSTFLLSVCVCVDPDVSFYSRIQLLEICKDRKELVTERKSHGLQTDRLAVRQRERERNFLAFLLHASSCHFSWAAHRSLCFAAEGVIISRRCKLVWS